MSAKRAVRSFINRLLSKIDHKLVWMKPDRITGSELFPDLAVLIGGASPVCLDVGANRGQTIAQLREVFDRPRIYAFEPSGTMFETLRSGRFDERVSLFNFALGASDQSREFINYENPFLSSFLPLDPDGENRFGTVAEAGRETVRVMTVDTFLAEHGIGRVDLLKIDTQGFDLEVLQGAKRTLEAGGVDFVLVELNFVKMYEGQAAACDVIGLLERYGLYLIDYYEKERQADTLAWCSALFGKRRPAARR